MNNGTIKQVKARKLIAKDRKRTNILRNGEQNAIAYLVQRVPDWITSDGLTAIGFIGNIIVALSFVLGAYLNRYLLLIALLGFVINWFGDSLDGRLAYYRNKPRKWYGFSLDVTVDWIGTILIGLGFMLYAQGLWKYTGFFFVGMYGWEMITAQMRYKITGKYSIDSGFLGPTEVRIIIALLIISEVIFPTSIHYLACMACVILLISNIVETKKLMYYANELDAMEREERQRVQSIRQVLEKA